MDINQSQLGHPPFALHCCSNFHETQKGRPENIADEGSLDRRKPQKASEKCPHELLSDDLRVVEDLILEVASLKAQ